jgi:hypothetical protein
MDRITNDILDGVKIIFDQKLNEIQDNLGLMLQAQNSPQQQQLPSHLESSQTAQHSLQQTVQSLENSIQALITQMTQEDSLSTILSRFDEIQTGLNNIK